MPELRVACSGLHLLEIEGLTVRLLQRARVLSTSALNGDRDPTLSSGRLRSHFDDKRHDDRNSLEPRRRGDLSTLARTEVVSKTVVFRTAQGTI